jgi:hypothetical protein
MGRVYSTHEETMKGILVGKPEGKRPLGRPRRRWVVNINIDIKPGIDCARLPGDAMFVALPRKVDTMLPHAAERTLPRTNLARVEPNWRGFLVPRTRHFSVLCSYS